MHVIEHSGPAGITGPSLASAFGITSGALAA
jgi:hypothetical protein